MDAKEAIFEAMGWTEDKSLTDVMKQGKSWLNKILKPKAPSELPKVPGTSGNPMGELEIHDKKVHPKGYHGGRCKYRAQMAEMGIDVASLDKQRGLPTPPNNDYTKGGEGAEEEEEKEKPATPPKNEIFAQPQTTEIDGNKVQVRDQDQAAGAALMEEILNTSNYTDEEKVIARGVLEKLLGKLVPQTGQVSAETVEQQEEVAPEAPVQQAVPEQPAPEEAAAETQEPAKEGEEETVAEEQIEDIDFSEPEEVPKEEAPAEEAAKTNALAGIKGKKDWTPKQKKALERLAARFGEAVNGIKSSVGTEKFNALLNKVSHYQDVQERWRTLEDPSDSRKEVESSLTEHMDKSVVKTFDDLVVDQIDKLLAMDVLGTKAISDSIKSSLEYDKGTLLYWYSTFAERQKAHEHFRKLCDKYGLDELLEEKSDLGKEAAEYSPENLRIFTNEYNGPLASEKLLDKPSSMAENQKELNKTAEKISQAMGAPSINLPLGDLVGTASGPSQGVLTFEVPVGFDIAKAKKSGTLQTLGLAIGGTVNGIEQGAEPNTIDITFTSKTPRTVRFSDVISSDEWKKNAQGMAIPNAVGIDSMGNTVVKDAAKGPHEVVTGATGTGKSVYLQSKIAAPKMVKTPQEWRQILIDPKQQEFSGEKDSIYNWCPVQFSAKGAATVLARLNQEMQERASTLGIDLSKYNEMTGEGSTDDETSKSLQDYNNAHPEKSLPFLSLVIDEVQSLTQDPEYGKQITENLANLLSRARSVGINVTVATQSDRVENLPGELRTNLPTKTEFPAAASDTKGSSAAKGLKNSGDFIQTDKQGKKITGRACWLKDNEIKNIHDFYKGQTDGNLPTEEKSPASQEQQIDEIAKTPGAKKGLTSIADKIGKGDMRPFNVPEGEKADAVKKYLESQGLTYIEKPTGTGKITITPQQKPVESGVSPSGAGAEASTPTSVSTTGTETGVQSPVTTKTEGAKPSPEREAERNSVNEDLRDEYDAFHKEFDDSISKSRQALEQKKASGKAKAMDYETARTQEAAALDTINMWRERNGLPKVTGVDKGGNYILEKTEEIETTTTPESKEEGLAGTATEENPYLDTKELESVPAGFDREELEDNAEALNAAQKQYAQSPKGSPERTKARDTIRRILKRDNALRNRLGMLARGDDGKITKTAEQEKSAPVKVRGIAPKDDVKGLSEEGKMRYDAALRRFNTAISSAREGLNSDALDDDQYMEAVKNATDSLNKTRKSLGFEKPVKSDGSFAEVVEEKTETAPEAKTTPVIPKTDAPENEPSAGEEIREEKETETEEIEVPSRTGRRGISKSKMESIKAEATKEPEAESTGAVSRADEEGSDLSASGKITAPRTTAASKATPTPSETNKVAESTSEESGSGKEAPTPAKAELSPEMQTRLEKARERKSERMLKAKKTPPEEKAEPEPSKTSSAAATPEKKVEEPKKPASDTPKDALTKGMEGLDAETRKAMQSNAGIQALQAKVVKARAEKGESSNEYKTAVRMLNTAQKQFAEAYRQSQEENSGVVDVRTTASKKSPKEEPEKESKKPVQAEKESAKKVETPAPKKTEEKKEPSTPEPKKEEPKKQEPKKETPATPEKPEAEASAPKEDEEETPQARAYRERKEAEEKAKAEADARKAEERAKRLEEAKQRGGRTLNTQSSQYAEQARKDADTSKSKGFKTLSEMKKPEEVDNKTANDLNRQFAEVAEEMQSLSDKLNTKTETSSLSPKETRQTVGLLESLRKGLEDVVDKTQLGKGNFNFRFLRDPDGKTIGLTITKYRGPDGKMKEVEELKETEEDKNEKSSSAKKEESSTSKKSVPETPTLFAGAEKARQEGQAKIEALKKSWEERKSRKTPTKDEALSEGYYWSEEVFDGETEEEKVWQEVFDAALFSMEQP